jgi:sugar/nucleoside kinase (ribokinase family)
MAGEQVVDIVVAGHICFDLIPTFPRRVPKTSSRDTDDLASLLIPGKLIDVGRLATSTGGPVSNTGLALKRLGVSVALIGKVGDDFIGKAIVDRLAQEHLAAGMHVVPGEESSYTVVISPPGVDRLFLHNPGANNTFGVDDIDYALVEKAKLFHLGYPPLMQRLYSNDGEELAEIFRRAKALGVTTSLDMALPDPTTPAGSVNWRRALEKTVPYVDLFLPSVEETLFMLHAEEFMAKKKAAGARDMIDLFEACELTALSDELLRMGGTIIGIKCGYKGFYLRTASAPRLASQISTLRGELLKNWSDRELWEPSFHVAEIASATGSGDSAIAGFLAAFVRAQSAEQTLRYACAAGAHNVQVLDAVSGIKSWEETTADIERGWEKRSLDISAPGWRFDKKRNLWFGPNDSRGGH